MTTTPYELMRHALGVQSYGPDPKGRGSRWKKPYRNHFVAGADHVAIWDGLVAKGFATKSKFDGTLLTGGDPLYFVTDAGREVALAGLTFARRWGHGEPVNP